MYVVVNIPENEMKSNVRVNVKNNKKNKKNFDVSESLVRDEYVSSIKDIFVGKRVNQICSNLDYDYVYSKKTFDCSFDFSENELVFGNDTVDGKNVPNWLKTLKVEKLYEVLIALERSFVNNVDNKRENKVSRSGECKRNKNTKKHIKMDNELRELHRQHKIVLTALLKREDNCKTLVQRHIISLVGKMNVDLVAEISDKKAPQDYIGCNMPEIYVDHLNKNSKVCYITNVRNKLFEKALNTSRNVAFTAGSLKKRLREFSKNEYDPILWKHYLDKHMENVNTFSDFMSGNYSMWWKNFVPVEWFYVDTEDWNKFFLVMKQRIENLRERIFSYAHRYYLISKLPNYRKQIIFQMRKDNFKRIMSTPRVQAMFLANIPKCDIERKVYEECTNIINVEIDKQLIVGDKQQSFENFRVENYYSEDEEIEVIETKIVQKPVRIKRRKVEHKFTKPKIVDYFPNSNNPFDCSWFTDRIEFNARHFVNDYPGLEVQQFYKCESFESFLLKRIYICEEKFLSSRYDEKLKMLRSKPLNFEKFFIRKRFVCESKPIIDEKTEWFRGKPYEHALTSLLRFACITLIYRFAIRAYINHIGPFFMRVGENVGRIIYLCQYTNWAQDRVQDAKQDFNELWGSIKNFEVTTESRLLLLEVKTMFHLVYALRKKDYNNAIAWSSNLLVSRFNDLPQMLTLVQNNQEAVTTMFVATTAYMFFDRYKMPIDVYNHMCRLYDRGEEVTEFCADNSEEDIQLESGTFSTVLRPLISMFVGDKIKDLSAFQVRDLNQQWQLSNHMSRNIENLVDSSQVLVSFLLRLLFGFDITDIVQQKYVTQIMIVMTKFKEIKFQHVEIKADKRRMLEIMVLYEEATELKRNPRFQTVTSYITTFFDKLYFEFASFAKECSDLIRGANVRAEPICIMFTGPPSVGKTATCNFLMQAMSWGIYGKKYDSTMTYTLNKRNDFWEGYNSNKFVLIDDIFSSTDPDHRRMEAEALIGMVNTAPFNLPMAFENKGSMFFDSDFIFCSTNIANDGINNCKLEIGVTDPRAVRRRYHWIVHKTTAYDGSDLSKMKFRVDQAPKGFDLGEIDGLSLCKNLMNMHKNKRVPEIMEYDEFLRLFGTEFVANSQDEGLILDDDENGNVYLETKEQPVYDESDIKFQMNNTETMRQTFSKMCDAEIPHSFIGAYYSLFIKETNVVFASVEVAVKVFGFLLGLYGVVKLYEYCKEPGELEIESHVKRYPNNSGKTFGNTNKQRQKTAKLRTFKRFREVKHKPKWNMVTQSNDMNFERASMKAARGTVFLYCAALSGGTPIYRETCVGFHVRDGIICTVAHCILKFAEYEHVELYMKYDGKITQLDIDECLVIDGEDLCLLKMPDNSNRPPSMYKYFASCEEKYNYYTGMQMMMVSCTDGGTPIFRSVTKVSGPDECEYSLCGEQIIVNDPITYSAASSPGDSGSMLFMPGLQGQPILIGMHLGYQETFCSVYRIALPLWKEYYDDICKPFYEEVKKKSSLPTTEFKTESREFPHAVSYEVDIDKAFFHPKKSKIRRSKLYGVFGPPTFIPTHLDIFKNKEGIDVDPAMIGLLKFKQVNFETTIPSRVIDYLFNLYPRIRDASLFNYDEVVNGRINSGVVSIKASTSPGYPYCLTSKKGKSEFVQFNGDKFEVKPEFIEEVKVKENSLVKGEQIEVIWADVLKDETRPIEKVEKGKTRVFSTCPLDYLFLVRRYFGSFVGEIQKHSVDKPVAVGINVHSNDWTRLYHRLASKGQSIIAGDFESYDTTLCQAFGKFFVNFVNNWYDDGPINARVRELLFEHVYNAVHIFGNKVYKLQMGNPSGNPLTAIYNSFCNIIATYLILVEDLNFRENEFEMTVYGDDNVIALKRPDLRCSDLAPYYLKRFGLKYTHFSKDEVEPYDTLETIRYLGRQFVVQTSIHRAPLELRVVLEMVYWIRGSTGTLEKFLSTVEAFMIEMSHFPQNIFDEYQNVIIGKIKDLYYEAYLTVVKNRRTYWYYFEGMYDPNKFVKFTWFESNNHTTSLEFFGDKNSSDFKKEYHLVKSTIRLESSNGPSKEVKLLCRNKPVEFEVKSNDVEERQANDVEDTQISRIGAFADVSVVDHTTVTNNLMSMLQSPLNFEEYSLDQILERTYEIGSFNWTESLAVGALLTETKFPAVLFEQPFIQQKMAGYKYFKAKLRLSFRVSSSKYLYGKLIASVDPYETEWPHQNTVERMSGLPHILLSASESSTVVLDVPFINQKRAIDLTNYRDAELCQVVLRVLHPLHNTDGTTGKAVVTMYAQFLDVKLGLPFSFVPESKKHEIMEAEVKSRMKSVSSRFEATKSNKMAIMRSRVMKKASPFLEKATEVAETVANIAMVASMIGLNKPVTTDKVTSVTSIPDLDLMSGNGLSHAIKVGYDVDNSVSTAPICGVEGDEMLLTNIVSTPMISISTAFLPGTIPTPLGIAGPQIDFAGPFKPTYVDWVSNQFLYVSGSFKYKFYITAGLFQAIRLVFYLAPDSIEAVEWESCYHKIVDVQGDTEVSFKVPYMNEYVMNSTIKPTTTPAIWCKVLSWSTPNPTVSAPIYIAVYKAGCSDMKFGCPLEKITYLQSNPRNDFALDFEFLHQHMTEYQHEGIVIGEEIKSVRDIIHRLVPYYNVSKLSIIEPYDFNGNSTPSFHMGLEMWGDLFKFYRGSIRVAVLGKKCSQVGNLTLRTVPVSGYPNYNLPFVKFMDKDSGIAQIEIPYYNDKPFNTTYQSHPLQVLMSGIDEGFMLKGAGDDFSFGFLVPPTTIPTIPPFGFGVNQVRTWYNI